MQLIALGDLYRCAKLFIDSVCKRLPRIATIDQNAFNVCQVRGATGNGLQRTGTIGFIGGGDSNGMRQTERIYGYMPFDARDFFAAIVAFFFRTIGILHTLCIDDNEAC